MEESPVPQNFLSAIRKAEESASRRYQASVWLESVISPLPLPLPTQPSEREFMACLRNGVVLCNLMNKIQPGIVPKVIDISENQSLPAYQCFENVRNFVVAVERLNLPAFEASDLGKDSVDARSTERIVDCILSLKSYHERKQWSDGSAGHRTSGLAKHWRSPIIVRSTGRILSRSGSRSSGGQRRHLDMTVVSDKTPCKEGDSGKLEDSAIESSVEPLPDSKENISEACPFTPKRELCSLERGTCNHWKISEVNERELSDSIDAGPTAKIVDCILSPMSYHEWKQWSDGSAGSGLSSSSKHLRSPMVLRSTDRSRSQFGNTNSGRPCRNLEMTIADDKTPLKEGDTGKLEEEEKLPPELVCFQNSCVQSKGSERSYSPRRRRSYTHRSRSPYRSRSRRPPSPRSRRRHTARHRSRSRTRRRRSRDRSRSWTRRSPPRERSPSRRRTFRSSSESDSSLSPYRRTCTSLNNSDSLKTKDGCRNCGGGDHRVFHCPDLADRVEEAIEGGDGALLVSNFSENIDWTSTLQVDDLFFYFSRVGLVKSIYICADDMKIILKYVWRSDAQKVAQHCERNLFQGKKLQVELY